MRQNTAIKKCQGKITKTKELIQKLFLCSVKLHCCPKILIVNCHIFVLADMWLHYHKSSHWSLLTVGPTCSFPASIKSHRHTTCALMRENPSQQRFCLLMLRGSCFIQLHSLFYTIYDDLLYMCRLYRMGKLKNIGEEMALFLFLNGVYNSVVS